MIKLRFLKFRDYLGLSSGFNVITRLLTREKWEGQRRRSKDRSRN